MNDSVVSSWLDLPESIDLLYADIPFGTGDIQSSDRGGYQDIKKGEVGLFVKDMLSSVGLSNNANVLIHCDWRSKWDVKQVLDETGMIFECEIVWCYRSGGASKKRLPNKFDTIFWYSQSKDRVYNIEREPYPYNYSDRKDSHKFHKDGKMVTDWWDIPILSTSALERVGYPNQKPLKLMDRIIKMFSNPESIVVDPCCGSGSFLVSAARLGRYNYYGCDISPEARHITIQRLVLH